MAYSVTYVSVLIIAGVYLCIHSILVEGRTMTLNTSKIMEMIL